MIVYDFEKVLNSVSGLIDFRQDSYQYFCYEKTDSISSVSQM